MSTKAFAKLIKDLKRETLEIKNTHRRSTLTVETITKSITIPASAVVDSYGVASYTAYIRITFNSNEPQIGMVSFDDASAASPFVMSSADPVITNDGKTVIILIVERTGQTPGDTLSANIKLSYTSTGDFTLALI